jgi:hypothetical protein
VRAHHLVILVAALLAPATLRAQGESRAGGERVVGPWALHATVQAGNLPSVGVLRLASPRVAVLAEVNVAASRDVTTNDRLDPFADPDTAARYADRSVNRRSGVGVRAGVRLYGAPIARAGSRGAPFLTLGVLGVHNRFSYRRRTTEPGVDEISTKVSLLTFGSYAQVGAIAMLTPRLGLGASGELVALVSVDSNSDNRQRTVYFSAPALVVTAFF